MNPGVSAIKIQANYSEVKFYQNGWYNADSPKVQYEESRKMAVHHEIVHLKDYDSKHCKEDQNYRYDFCRNDFIHKVHI